MNISLPAEQEQYVNGKVKAGAYACTSDVIRAALRLMKDRDDEEQEEIEFLRREIQKGIDSFERDGGIPLDFESIKARGRAMLEGKA